jgi:ubiquinone/menaquinone biosynthesis C-methylase UbiE
MAWAAGVERSHMENATQPVALEDGMAPSLERLHPPARRWLSEAQLTAIRQVDHFRCSGYRDADLNRLLDDYMRDFVDPLLRLNASPRAVADVGAGYGWLALAFALRTEARIVAVEYDGGRLQAARRIAAIAGVAERIEWMQASIADLPLPDRSMDAVYCIEVIEHTGVDTAFVDELCRIGADVLVITTPNKLFPVINHDTALPFCHWLPPRARDLYAAAFRRRHRQENNLFWSASRLLGSVQGFERVSRFMQFNDFAEYRDRRTPGGPAARCLHAYLALAACFGRHAIYMLPNLASTFRRCDRG